MTERLSSIQYPVRQETLAQLRWVAIAGQLASLIFCYFYLDTNLNFIVLFEIVGVWAVINFAQQTLFRYRPRLSNDWSFWFLVIDLVELWLMLFLTGGLHNPFTLFLIVPVVLAATALPARLVLIMFGLGVLSLLSLHFFAKPIQVAGEELVLHSLLEYGHLAASLLGMAFLSFFARRITLENLNMTTALAASELALQREHRLTALGGLVAAYAHELGTPLATIRLTANDLLDANLKDHERADVALIKEEVLRCSQILSDMGELGKDDMLIKTLPFAAIVEEAAQPHIDRGKEIQILINGESAQGEWSPMTYRSASIVHALRNLIQNAVDFARARVWIEINFDNTHLTLRIIDDGSGFPLDVINRLGEPYLRSRQNDKRPEYKGMGLGLFISKTLLESTGATLSFANRPKTEGEGAIVRITWALEDIEIEEEESRTALGENPKHANHY